MIGCKTIEHGTASHTEDQLFVSGDELKGARHDRF
jgi:hypothetical protein